jgi:hypothetical protein
MYVLVTKWKQKRMKFLKDKKEKMLYHPRLMGEKINKTEDYLSSSNAE